MGSSERAKQRRISQPWLDFKFEVQQICFFVQLRGAMRFLARFLVAPAENRASKRSPQCAFSAEQKRVHPLGASSLEILLHLLLEFAWPNTSVNRTRLIARRAHHASVRARRLPLRYAPRPV